MSLLNPALLAGLGLVLIPVVLHLLFRAKPKRMVFPALRLVLQRHQATRRRMRVRHLRLLLLRIAAIALLVMACTRPALPPANYGLGPGESGLLAAIVIVGGSLWWWLAGQPGGAWLFERWRGWRGHPSSSAANDARESSRRLSSAGATRPEVNLWPGRLALVATAVLAGIFVGWPYVSRVQAEMVAPPPTAADNIPAVAVMVVDHSLSMGYQQDGKSRLQVAHEIADRHLQRLPRGSRVAVIGPGRTGPELFLSDLTAAKSRLDQISLSPAVESLDTLIQRALNLHRDDREKTRLQTGGAAPTKVAGASANNEAPESVLREIYVLTDLARSAWNREQSTVARELQESPTIGLYLIDTGVPNPTNVAISRIDVEPERGIAGTPATVIATINASGATLQEQLVELRWGPGESQIQKQTWKPSGPGESRVEFRIDRLDAPLVQGSARLTAADPLAADDQRPFSIAVRSSPRVLLIAEDAAATLYLREALAPEELVKTGLAKFDTRVVLARDWKLEDLAGSDVVCLVNVSQPGPALWAALEKWTIAGGGLAVFLGSPSSLTAKRAGPDTLVPTAYNSEPAARVLPVKLLASLKPSKPVFWDPRSRPHPFMDRLEQFGAFPELSDLEIRRYWTVEPLPDGRTVTVLDLESQPPLLVERSLGRGRVALWTTSFSSLDWNDFPRTGNWTYVAILDQLLEYLLQSQSRPVNYEIGQPIRIPVDRRGKATEFLLRTPQFQQLPLEWTDEQAEFALPPMAELGNYQIAVADTRPPEIVAGWSVAMKGTESDLTRLSSSELDQLLGPQRYQVVRDLDTLERVVNIGRLGQEVFGIVVAILIAVFVIEHFAANWFYDAAAAAEPTPGRAATAA